MPTTLQNWVYTTFSQRQFRRESKPSISVRYRKPLGGCLANQKCLLVFALNLRPSPFFSMFAGGTFQGLAVFLSYVLALIFSWHLYKF